MRLTARVEAHALTEPFAIARHVYTEANVLRVEIAARGAIGRGEAAGVDYLGDTPQTMLVQVQALARELEAGMLLDRACLAARLPARRGAQRRRLRAVGPARPS